MVDLVLADLPRVDPSDERFEAKMTVLKELVEHHAGEEEEEMFKVAKKLGDETLEELGNRMSDETKQLQHGRKPATRSGGSMTP